MSKRQKKRSRNNDLFGKTTSFDRSGQRKSQVDCQLLIAIATFLTAIADLIRAFKPYKQCRINSAKYSEKPYAIKYKAFPVSGI